MENAAISKQTVSFGLSLALCAVVNAVLVVAKEKSKVVAAAMQRLTGHHWITHVAVIVFLFSIFGWIFGRMNGGQGPHVTANLLTTILVSGVTLGVVVVLGFYIIAG